MFRPGRGDVFSYAFALYLWAWQHLLSEVSFGSMANTVFGLQGQAGYRGKVRGYRDAPTCVGRFQIKPANIYWCQGCAQGWGGRCQDVASRSSRLTCRHGQICCLSAMGSASGGGEQGCGSTMAPCSEYALKSPPWPVGPCPPLLAQFLPTLAPLAPRISSGGPPPDPRAGSSGDTCPVSLPASSPHIRQTPAQRFLLENFSPALSSFFSVLTK